MLKNKLLLFSLLFGLSTLPTFSSEVLSEVQFPKAPAYRVGISELPEKQYIQIQEEKVKQAANNSKITDMTDANLTDLTYADLSIKKISKEIAQELEYEEQDMLADLSLLWQGAAIQSDTINFALYKLANPDADKPDEKSLKNVLKTIASMSTLVGASMGSPIIAGSSLIGGNIFGIMSQDTKSLNYKYTRVNDADMIILIRKVEDLQQRAVDLYYDYMSAKKQLEFANNLVEDRKYKFELAQKNNAARELVVITDAYYRTALDKQRSAKSEFFSKRAALEQFVGHETFAQFENELAARERGEKTNANSSTIETPENIEQQNSEYQKTIEDVKIYTENINANSEISKIEGVQLRANKEVVPETIQEESLTIPINDEISNNESKLQLLKNKFQKSEKVNSSKATKEATVKQKKLENDTAKPEKIKVEKPKKETAIRPTNNTQTEELAPLNPITMEDYMNTVSEIENNTNSNTYENSYDFSEEERTRIKYFGDHMYDGMTGLAASTDEQFQKKSFLNKFKKNKTDINEKQVKEKKEKVDSKSTKNLIFLHGEDKNSAKSKFNFNINGQEIQGNDTQLKPSQTPKSINQEFNLLPLDEIKVPDLTKDGYSIHSEYTY